MTPQQELDLTVTALQACLTAQSYSLAGRAKQMAQYRDLTARIDELRQQIATASESSGSMCSLGQMEPVR